MPLLTYKICQGREMRTGMLANSKVKISFPNRHGNQFCNKWSADYILNILHVCVCWFCSVHTKWHPLNFFMWDLRWHTLLPLPKTVIPPLILMLLFIFPSLSIFFPNWPAKSVSVSQYHHYIQILSFSCYEKVFLLTKVWVNTKM